jgi:hypothetical protein
MQHIAVSVHDVAQSLRAGDFAGAANALRRKGKPDRYTPWPRDCPG